MRVMALRATVKKFGHFMANSLFLLIMVKHRI